MNKNYIYLLFGIIIIGTGVLIYINNQEKEEQKMLLRLELIKKDKEKELSKDIKNLFHEMLKLSREYKKINSFHLGRTSGEKTYQILKVEEKINHVNSELMRLKNEANTLKHELGDELYNEALNEYQQNIKLLN